MGQDVAADVFDDLAGVESATVAGLLGGARTVNARTGRPEPGPGYAPATIGHVLTVVFGFYDFHLHFGRGPLVNRFREQGSPACLGASFAERIWVVSKGTRARQAIPASLAAGEQRRSKERAAKGHASGLCLRF